MLSLIGFLIKPVNLIGHEGDNDGTKVGFEECQDIYHHITNGNGFTWHPTSKFPYLDAPKIKTQDELTASKMVNQVNIFSKNKENVFVPQTEMLFSDK